jgi:RNA polymerase sigma-70 factor (ECF subfamily)
MQAINNGHINVDELVARAQEGDVRAFSGLYEHFYDQIYRYVSFKAGSPLEAEDITAEVFVRMLESIKSFKWQGYPFSSWLFRIAHNLVVDHFRRKGKRKYVALDSIENTLGESAPDIDGYVDQELAMEDVKRAMHDLTDLQKEVISLRFAAGLSVAETAKAVGRKENAVKALQHAGLKKLKKLLSSRTEPIPGTVLPLGLQEE